MSDPTQTEITQGNHRRAVRFFWGLLIGATAVSLIGNITHAVLPYIPGVAVQIGAAAVPPIALLAAVHGIALAVRAGASGRVYRGAVSAVAGIGVGAFAVSFLALRDLMQAIGYSNTTAWIFPAIIDTAVAVSTLMLVALGDKPARRARTATASANTQTPAMQRLTRRAMQRASAEITAFARAAGAPTVQPERVQHLCIGTTRAGADPAGVSANRAGHMQKCTRRCKPCVRADCVACDYPARRNRDRGAGGHSPRRVDQRRRQSVGDQLPDCAAHRGGCRRASAGTARGGFLRRLQLSQRVAALAGPGRRGGAGEADPGRRTRHSHRRSPSRGIRPQPVSGGAPRGAYGPTALPQS